MQRITIEGIKAHAWMNDPDVASIEACREFLEPMRPRVIASFAEELKKASEDDYC